MKRIFIFTWILIAIIAFSGLVWAQGNKLTVGVTLHPYYSWVKNIVGDTMNVQPVVPPDVDPHSYQPRPGEMHKLMNLDAIVINGLGHDDYIKPMLKAAGRENVKILDPHVGLPLIPVFTTTYTIENDRRVEQKKVSYNSHTYISITGAIQQINTLARELGLMQPADAALYRKNARAYAGKLRQMLLAALQKINAQDASKLRIATVHDGYAYLMQELGLEVAAVIQPRHGIEPDPRQLRDTIDRIKQAKVNVLFAETDYAKRYIDIIFQETGCRIYALTHVSNGEFATDKFEKDMQKNLDTIVKAMTDAN